MRVLVVDDEIRLASLIRRGLRREGLLADIAVKGEDALWMAASSPYDALTLDMVLPGIDGLEVCRRLREDLVRTPILMLTGRDAVEDRIAALNAGADDYLVKPFDFGELLARLRALGRRSPPEPRAVLEIGDLRFDPATRVVRRAGIEVELTVREFEVLELLARHGGQVVSRQQLLEEIWHDDYNGSPNIVDVYVGYLRKKLEDPSGPRLIRTVRGVGFRLESE
jgi:two-component system, OmpR family, response regulator